MVGHFGKPGRASEYDTLLGAAQRLQGQDDILFLPIDNGAAREPLMYSRFPRHMDVPAFSVPVRH
jgi:hypothetical protein